MRLVTVAAVATCVGLAVAVSHLPAERGGPSGPGAEQRARQTEGEVQQTPAPQPIAVRDREAQPKGQDRWQVAGMALQAVMVALMLWAVLYYGKQARHARDAVQAAVTQALTDRMIAQVRHLCDHPDVTKEAFPQFMDLPDDRVKVYMAVHPFLLHFENVIALRDHLPEGHWDKYRNSMVYIMSLSPPMHEWMNVSGNVWSDELRVAAAESLRLAAEAAQEVAATRRAAPPGP